MFLCGTDGCKILSNEPTKEELEAAGLCEKERESVLDFIEKMKKLEAAKNDN